jgi:hypothetical protein
VPVGCVRAFNTDKIAKLEDRAAGVAARLAVFDTLLKGLTELVKKSTDTNEGHGSRITIVEQQVLVIADLKTAVATIASIKEELVAIKKDIEGLQSWKADQKKEKEEAVRRWWSFGPNITAAIIGGIITILGVLTSVGLTYFLNRPK